MVWTTGAVILQKSRLKFKIVGANVQNLVAQATWSPGFVIL
jgi:hypothetical protein